MGDHNIPDEHPGIWNVEAIRSWQHGWFWYILQRHGVGL